MEYARELITKRKIKVTTAAELSGVAMSAITASEWYVDWRKTKKAN
jgi:hypothetical protein